MHSLQDLAYWWYNNYGVTPQPMGVYICGTIAGIIFVGMFLYQSWNDNLRKGDGVLLGTLLILIQCLVGALAVFILFPLMILLGTLWLINGGLSKWGNNYRKLEKSKEKRREDVLRDMLDSDPVFMEKYRELMNSTPKI